MNCTLAAPCRHEGGAGQGVMVPIASLCRTVQPQGLLRNKCMIYRYTKGRCDSSVTQAKGACYIWSLLSWLEGHWQDFDKGALGVFCYCNCKALIVFWGWWYTINKSDGGTLSRRAQMTENNSGPYSLASLVGKLLLDTHLLSPFSCVYLAPFWNAKHPTPS